MAWATPAMPETLHGMALLRERIALPDGLVFEATIEDISRAGAPSERLAATRFETTGQPPFAFEIAYDPAALRPQARYSVRATLHRDGRLFASTDTVHPVLEDGTADTVEVVMRLVPVSEERPLPVHGLRLPASFTGTLPCDGCDGVRHHLDLWPDQVYALSREWLGRADGPTRRDEMGRWYADPDRDAIVLHGAAEMPLFWQVIAPDRLRQMDPGGNRIEASYAYELASAGRFAPTDLHRLFVVGEVLVGADGLALRDCLTDRVFPIDADGDHAALNAVVEAERETSDTPLLVHVDARITQPPPGLAPQVPWLKVLAFNRRMPGESCDRHRSTATLTNTYWRISTLRGAAVARLADVREAHLILREDEARGFVATVGCNRLTGGYDLDGDTLRFTPGATTLMACPPPLDAAEDALRGVLASTRRHALAGQSLILQDAGGVAIAELEAVYLR